MPMENTNSLYLHEALELRSEYDARIQTIKDCLERSRGGRRSALWHDERGKRRPSPDFDPADQRERLRMLEVKRRKLNSAIQKANYETSIECDGQSMNILEALDLRKAFNRRLGELVEQLADSAYETVIYKEDRDIVESSDLSYAECSDGLEQARLSFRMLNRKLRWASFETQVDFRDE